MPRWALLFLLLLGCSHHHNRAIVTQKADHYISPDKKVDVEILIEKDNNHDPQSYVGRVILKPGTKIGKHIHKMSDEYLYFIKGTGVISIEGEEHQVKDGSTFYIPLGMKHSYTNTSKKTAVAIQFYTPAGPEQRFKVWKKK